MVAKLDYYLMSSDNITDIVVAVLAAATGASGQKLLDYWKTRKDNIRKASLVSSLQNMNHVYTAMRDVVENTGATRFIVFKGSNGGGLPRPGQEFYASAVQEYHEREDHERMVERYKRVPVDAGYIQMLLELVVSGKKTIVVDDMEPGLLRNIYKAEGIRYSELYYLAKSEKEIFYCSIATSIEQERLDDDAQRVEIDLAIGRMREIFRQYV